MWGRGEHVDNPNGIESQSWRSQSLWDWSECGRDPQQTWMGGRGEDGDNPNGIGGTKPKVASLRATLGDRPTNIPNRNAVAAIPFPCVSRKGILPQPRCG